MEVIVAPLVFYSSILQKHKWKTNLHFEVLGWWVCLQLLTHCLCDCEGIWRHVKIFWGTSVLKWNVNVKQNTLQIEKVLDLRVLELQETNIFVQITLVHLQWMFVFLWAVKYLTISLYNLIEFGTSHCNNQSPVRFASSSQIHWPTRSNCTLFLRQGLKNISDSLSVWQQWLKKMKIVFILLRLTANKGEFSEWK